MKEIDSQIFINIGNSLININESKNTFINTEFNKEKDNKKIYQEYKQEYIYKLRVQLKSIEKDKIEIIDEYNKTLKLQKKTLEKIEILHKRLHFKENYFRSNSITNFIIMHIKNIKKTLDETIHINDNLTEKLYELKNTIHFLDNCIYKITLRINNI
jgi:hypothetical protein